MTSEELKSSISQYKQQLNQINFALSATEDDTEKQDLINLKADIVELIELTEENLKTITKNDQPSASLASTSGANDVLEDEYSLFMKEMEKEGAIECEKPNKSTDDTDIEDDLKSLEGMKCQAPHTHSWGDIVYHNALVCGIIPSEKKQTFNEIEVRIIFTNPTHQEMLPCPYFLDGNCKFDSEKCRFSHGEVVLLSKLQEYKEPKFSALKIDDRILAKRPNNLWHRAVLKKYSGDECTVKFESNQEDFILPLHDILPLDHCYEETSSDSEDDDEDDEDAQNDWLVQKSLLNTPPSQILGDWEKHTKGIGSKLMQKMGYVIGTGLGRKSDGRLEPVEAVVLPAGKSLDHCMTLRENSGGDESLFSVEKRLKKLQKQQEIRNQKAYEREKNKKDVFEFLNESLVLSKNKNTLAPTKCKNRQEIKSDSNRDLNVASLKIEEDIKRVGHELFKIKESLTRHNNPDTAMNKSLKTKLINKQEELKRLEDYSKNVLNEQKLRNNKKKMTIF